MDERLLSTMTRKCTICGQTKAISEFPGRGDNPQSIRPFCRACDHAHREEKRRNNKEKTLMMLDVLDEYGLNAWDLLPDESTQAHAAFTVYRTTWVDHPTKKRPTTLEIAVATGWSQSAIVEWRSQFLWDTRVVEYLRELDRERQEAEKTRYFEEMEKQRTSATKVHTKAMASLEALRPDELTPKEAIALLRLATSLTQETFKLLPIEEIQLRKPQSASERTASEVTINQVSATEVTVGESTVRSVNHTQDTVARALDILKVLQAANALPDSFGAASSMNEATSEREESSSDYTDVYTDDDDDDDDRPE